MLVMQRVLITAGAAGIGREIARAFVGAGARVCVLDIDATALAALRVELPAVTVEVCDLAELAQIEAVVPRAIAALGGLDVLVNNASSFYPTAIGSIEAGHWDELIGSNLRAPLFIAQEAAPAIRKQRGAIVNIADIHAERPLKGYAVYSIAKAGLVAMTRVLALELGPEVRVNAVAPGAIAWPEDGQFAPDERARVVATTPLERLGAPAEVARAVHFLATAPFVTGQVLAVDGGRSVFL